MFFQKKGLLPDLGGSEMDQKGDISGPDIQFSP